MSLAASTLAQLPSSMQGPIKHYIDRVQELAGTNCVAITGFGSIATPQFDAARDVAKSVVVLDHIDLAMLRELAKDGVKLGKARIAAPLIMTPVYINDSLDAFPLEFLEIQQCHICLIGPDHFSDLIFSPDHIRLQCERELKTILIAMRQGLLATAGREKLLSSLEGDIIERLIRTLRGLLWLHETTHYLPSSQVIEQVEQETNRSLPSIKKVAEGTPQHGWEIFTALYQEIDGLKTLADQW